MDLPRPNRRSLPALRSRVTSALESSSVAPAAAALLDSLRACDDGTATAWPAAAPPEVGAAMPQPARRLLQPPSEEQRAVVDAVLSGACHVRVNAVAGSGKTTTLLHVAAEARATPLCSAAQPAELTRSHVRRCRTQMCWRSPTTRG
jgi:hypothetical protein